MRSKTILLLSILVLVVFHSFRYVQPNLSIGNTWYDSYHSSVDLHVPDEVVSHSSPYHEFIAQTGLSMVRPGGFEEKINSLGFYNKDTSIEISSEVHVSLAAKKQMVADHLNAISSESGLHERLEYRKDFKFNGYDAILVCVSDTTCTRAVIYMAFGDEHFNIAMTGKMAAYSDATSAELIRTMLSACYGGQYS